MATNAVSTSADDQSVAAAEMSGTNGLVFNFKNAPLGTVLDYLSKKGGYIIVGGGGMQARERIDLESATPVSKAQLPDLLNTVLKQTGYLARLIIGRSRSSAPRTSNSAPTRPLRLVSIPTPFRRTTPTSPKSCSCTSWIRCNCCATFRR